MRIRLAGIDVEVTDPTENVTAYLKNYAVPEEGPAAFSAAGGDLVLHRVIGVLPEGYLIRGDNCIGTENVRREAVLGKLCGIQRNGDCIEVTDEMNDAFFKRSCRTLPARKWKARILGILRRIRKHAGLAQR